MGGSKKGQVTNQERPLSQQELKLMETQNLMQQQAINIAQTQENRAKKNQDIYEENYLPMEVQLGGREDKAEAYRQDAALDNQMPVYEEDSSGAREQGSPPPQQAPVQQASGSGGMKGIGSAASAVAGQRR